MEDEFKKNLQKALNYFSDPIIITELLRTNSDKILGHPMSSEFMKRLVFKVVRCSNEKIVEVFIKFFESEGKNDPEKQLIVAIFKGNIQDVELLLKNGVSLAGKMWEGNYLPAIYSSVFFRYTYDVKDMLILLIKHGLDTAIKNEKNENLLHALSGNFRNGDDYNALEIAKILFDSGVPIDEVDNDGFSPLQRAIQGGHELDIVKFFIDKGADVNRKSNDGDCFPLVLSISMCCDEAIADLLISSGADINAKESTSDKTALHEACSYCLYFHLDLLLKRGADMTVEDINGNTPFLSLDTDFGDYNDCLLLMIKRFSMIFAENISKITNEHGKINAGKSLEKVFSKISLKDLRFIVDTDEINEHLIECIKEIKQMKSTKFYPPYSYHQVLNISKDIKKLAKLTSNEEFVAKFNTNLDSFSYFKENLIENFNDAFKVRNDSEIVLSRLNSIFKQILPDLVIRIVAESLTATDLPTLQED